MTISVYVLVLNPIVLGYTHFKNPPKYIGTQWGPPFSWWRTCCVPRWFQLRYLLPPMKSSRCAFTHSISKLTPPQGGNSWPMQPEMVMVCHGHGWSFTWNVFYLRPWMLYVFSILSVTSDVMWLKHVKTMSCLPSPSHHHFYRLYVYHSRSWVVKIWQVTAMPSEIRLWKDGLFVLLLSEDDADFGLVVWRCLKYLILNMFDP